jgi:ankyrin repeat protein
MLLAEDVAVNAAAEDGSIPIQYALEEDQADILGLLLDFGADPTVRGERNRTLLMIAAANGNEDGVALLMDAAPRLINARDSDGWTALLYALRSSADDNSGLNRAATRLIRRGARLDASGDAAATVAHSAARHGNTEVLSVLLEEGLDERLGSRRGDGVPDSEGLPLVFAALDDADVVRLLVEYRADLNVLNREGQTALIVATIEGDIETVETLLSFRIRLDVTDRASRTALMYAAANANEEILRQLLVAGAETWARDSSGNTALHYAARSGTARIVRVLITAGADVNAANSAGRRPIDEAASNPESAEIIDILLEAGATPSDA